MIRKPGPRKRPLSWERLEDRQLLSGLTYSLTSDQSSYHVGQPIQFTFTETNTSTQPITVGLGAVTTGFNVAQNGVVVWESNAGIQPQSVIMDTLQPGQGVTLHATWNGIPNQIPPSILTGSFTVTNQQAGATAGFQIIPPTGTKLAAAVTTDKTDYQVGQPVQMTFTETNMGAQPVEVIAGNGTFDVSQNGTAIWNSSFPNPEYLYNLSWQTLQPGQTLTEQATWNGEVLNPSTGAATGTFTLTNELAPSASSTFVIQPAPTSVVPVSPQPTPTAGPAIVARLVTSSTTYRLGQPVSIKLELTNTTQQSVTLSKSTLDSFTVSRGSQIVWHQAATGIAGNTQSIAPGQTITFSATWTGRPNQHGVKPLSAGIYTVTAEEGNQSVTTTVQVGKVRTTKAGSDLARPLRSRK